jgi:hypothetical protein
MGGSDDGKNVRASIDISTDFRVKRFFPLLGKQDGKFIQQKNWLL